MVSSPDLLLSMFDTFSDLSIIRRLKSVLLPLLWTK